MFNQNLQEKWAPLLDCEGLDHIKDPHRRAVTAQLLENQENFLREERGFISEAGPTMSAGTGGFGGGTYGTAAAAGPVAGFDPVLISLIRRSMPQLIAYDICGVQPMNGPTGLIFAMRTRYTNNSGTEAFFNEADSRFSGQNAAGSLAASDYTAQASVGIATTAAQSGSNPGVLNDSPAGTYNVGQAMATGSAEALGDATTNAFAEMAFSIEKVTVAAKSRALKAEYSLELAQDLKAIHGLDAEAELANILSTEILAEINREVVRTIYNIAEAGAQNNTATAGIFDLDVDSNGRWSVEKFKGLLFQLERDANAIAIRTRRGKGNTIVCSSDVASALTMAGVLDYTPALNANLQVDDTGNTFAGVINGKYKVYIDPYSGGVNPNASGGQYYVIGYKGTNPYDAGLFYCPYVPLQMVRAVGQDTFQPKIGFKTRYGMVANPFAEGSASDAQGLGRLKTNSNRYYRRVQVKNLM
ncbi:major capsid protein [Synechococcus phage DSL-LC02]|nr:major capsid protein [Synechococcus phage DSL-LC02]